MAERLNVNPNRMELLKLRRRLAVARRGHKLLKDKLDELIKPFIAMVTETRDLRREVEAGLAEAYDLFGIARSETSDSEMETSLSFPRATADLKADTRNIMSVIVPEFELERKGGFDCYGLVSTPALYDMALGGFDAVLPRMVELAQKEKAVRLLAEEIERTRRRVNALEYVLIPQLEQTIRYITIKLDEDERANLTRLMKVKEMVR